VLGVGVRGADALQRLLPLPDGQVVAISDVRSPRREAAVRMVQNFYATVAAKGTHRGCSDYRDFRDLLGREDIDAAMIFVPDHWHGIVYSQAARAGKDIYGEKPITRTIAEGWAVRDAVHRCGRVFQTGTQQRSDPYFRYACQLARNGYLGKIHTIKVGVPGGRRYPAEPPSPVPPGFDYDMWTGPARFVPFDSKRCEWLAMYMISHYCAGFICNWGVHHLDIAQWGCPEVTTEPFELDGKGVFPEDGMTDTCISWHVEFRYPSGLLMSFSDVRHPNESGCRFEGDQGWVRVDRGNTLVAQPESLLSVQFQPSDVQLLRSPLMHVDTRPGQNYEYDRHTADFLRSVRTRQEPVSPLESGILASTLGNVADIMVRLGRKVRWDWTTQRFLNDDEANHMLSRPMRSPWTL
jgi:predicted dehydrogenase